MRPWDVEKSQSWYYVCSLLVTGGKKFSQSLAITPLDESEQSPRDFREVRCTHAWFDERVYYFEHKIAVRIVNFREFTQTYNTNLCPFCTAKRRCNPEPTNDLVAIRGIGRIRRR